MMNTSSRNQKIFFFLTIIIGIIAVLPQIFYQPYLLQGDHGRDLYIFQQTAQGGSPYLDYRTANGPVMPFYYAAFLNCFGMSINSVLLGYALLIFLAGFLLFLISRRVIAPQWAFLCALWYWGWRGQEFFYTFNHIGAVVAGLATLLLTLISIEHQQKRYFVLAFLSSILCMCIRPDIGLASLAGLLLATFIYQRKDYFPQRSFFVFTFSFIGSMFVLINLFVPEMFAPYWHSIHWNYIFANLIKLFGYGFFFCVQNSFIEATAILLAALFLIGVYHIWNERREKAAQGLVRAVVCTAIFFMLFLMEYLMGFRFFRWVWVLSLFFLILFFGVYWGVKKLNPIIQNLICSTLALLCGLMIFLNYQDIAASKKDGSILNVKKTHLYMAGDQKPWIETIEKTSQYILEHTRPDDAILAFPYDAIYCFLTERKLATENPSLFGTTAGYVVPKLESKQVQLIVISNRAFRHNEEHLFGVFGREFGVNLWDYIQHNYTLAAQFGPWNQMATPIKNHATQIYLRATPFKPVQRAHPDMTDEL